MKNVMRAQNAEDRDGPMRPEVRWTIGIVVGLTALTGLMILVVLVSLALEPPAWLQIVMGVVLVAVACVLAWLVAFALGARDSRRAQERVDVGPNTRGSAPRRVNSR